jgi:hypothetical protein
MSDPFLLVDSGCDSLEIVFLVQIGQRVIDDPVLTFIQADCFDDVQQLGVFW